MTALPDEQERQCPRCSSKVVNPEWDERVSAGEVQVLWHCANCSHEFVTQAASVEEPAPEAEITKPFFTSLVVE